MRFISGESQVRSPTQDGFFSLRSASARSSFVLCRKHNERPRLMHSFIDGHENCRNLVSIQFVMFSLQAREPATRRCGTIANATRGKKVTGLVKLPVNLILALLHNEVASDSSKHKVCKKCTVSPDVSCFRKGRVQYTRECIHTEASFVCLLPASSEQL